MNATELAELITFAFRTHAEKPTKPRKAFRKWDKESPYAIHPVWCAMTLMSETSLPGKIRMHGAQALILHDIIEDTTAELPEGLDPEVVKLVEEMTFYGGSAEEMEKVWDRSDECLLLKLYDKVSNLLDSDGWLKPEKREKYLDYTFRLTDAVERVYGNQLNIVQIARIIIMIRLAKV